MITETIVVGDDAPTSGAWDITCRAKQRGALVGVRLQPGGAQVIKIWLSGVPLRARDFPAGALAGRLLGRAGKLHLAPGDELRIELKKPRGKRKLRAEFDLEYEE